MLYSDFNFVKEKDIIYTIDMIRLKTYISYDKWERLLFFVNTIYKKNISNYYMSNKINAFKYNYVLEFGENSSFWFGFHHNSEKSEKIDYDFYFNDKNNKDVQFLNFKKYNFTVEFNPNKIDLVYLEKFFKLSTEWTIQSIDIAMDIPLNILDIYCIDKERKREMKIFSNGYDDKTIYIGKSNNRVKIYNKKIESNLDIKNLTRIEISSQLHLDIKNIMSYEYNVKLPELFINEYMYSFSDYTKKNDTLRCILFALQHGYDFNDLSRDYKRKVKELIKGNYQINLSNEMCTRVLRKVIFKIFPYKNLTSF